ncbi:MAG: hypothetical protein Tsb0021_09350 [Chlamydiales bacterium]
MTCMKKDISELAHGKKSFLFLFLGLIFLLLIYPFVEGSDQQWNAWIFLLSYSGILSAIIYTISYSLKQFLIAFTFLIAIVLLYFYPSQNAQEIALSLHILFYVYLISIVLPYVLKHKRADIEDLYASVSLYILLGLAWSSIYQAIEFYSPNAFQIHRNEIPDALRVSDLIYFSFTTLTTLGYGDVTPVLSQAKMVSIIEAIMGVLFLSTIISRTIGLYIYELKEKEEQ